MFMRLTVNRNLTVHAADKYGTICGSELKGARRKVTNYRRLEDTADVTCRRCLDIIAARFQRTGGAAVLTGATPATPATQGGL